MKKFSTPLKRPTIEWVPDPSQLSTGRFAFLAFGTLFIIATVGASTVQLLIGGNPL